jgi:GH24 family phage-related lysozyme (muramidase)
MKFACDLAAFRREAFMDPGFDRKLKSALNQHEGFVDHFYKDSVGQVTIGVGNLVTEASFAELPLRRRSDGKPATPAEIAAAFHTVKNAAYLHVGTDKKEQAWSAGHYKNLAANSNVYLPQSESNKLLERHISKFNLILRQKFSKSAGYKREFDEFPENIRLALFDLMFNLGSSKFPAHWPHFVEALKAENWDEVARQSRRPQLSSDRNKYVDGLLRPGDPQSQSTSVAIPKRR